MDETQVRTITKKVLSEENLLGFIKIFEKEHNLFRGSHDKIKLAQDLNVPQQVVNLVAGQTKLEQLEDVSISSPSTGDFIQYDGGLEKWKRMAALTSGSVVFVGPTGYFIQDNPNLFWDNTNKILEVSGLSIRSKKELRFYDNGNYVGFEAPDLAANFIWKLPAVDGAGNDVLGTDAAGQLIWITGTSLGNVVTAGNFGTDNRILRSDGTGKGVQASGVTITDAGYVGIGAIPTDPLYIYGNSVDSVILKIHNDELGIEFDYMTIGVMGGTAYGVAGWVDSGVIECAAGSLVLGSYGGNMKFYAGTGRIAQVTLDTSGNLSMAGRLGAGRTTIDGDQAWNSATPNFTVDDDTSRTIGIWGSHIDRMDTASDTISLDINYTGYNGGATQFRDFTVWDGKRNQIAFFDGSTGHVTFAGDVYVPNHSTSAGAAQAGFNVATGLLYRSTSALKYKDKVKDLELNPSLIHQLRTVSFNSLCKVDDKKQRFHGLVADEVEQVIPAMAIYNKDNEIEGYDDRVLTTLLLAEVQKQRVEIDALKAQLNN